MCSSVCYFLDKWILNIWRSLNIAQGSNIRNIFSAILAYASTEHIHQHPGAMLSHCNLVLTFPSLQLKNIMRCDEKYSFKNISKTNLQFSTLEFLSGNLILSLTYTPTKLQDWALVHFIFSILYTYAYHWPSGPLSFVQEHRFIFTVSMPWRMISSS